MAKSSQHRGHLAGTHWNPELYQQFRDYRTRAGFELLDRVQLDAPAVIFDLGCGTGELTQLMAKRWPAASVTGVDSSAEMLARAKNESSRALWVESDIRTWEPSESPDLIFANASLQWIEDHEALFPRLAGMLREGGVLAVQMPLSWTAMGQRRRLASDPERSRRRLARAVSG